MIDLADVNEMIFSSKFLNFKKEIKTEEDYQNAIKDKENVNLELKISENSKLFQKEEKNLEEKTMAKEEAKPKKARISLKKSLPTLSMKNVPRLVLALKLLANLVTFLKILNMTTPKTSRPRLKNALVKSIMSCKMRRLSKNLRKTQTRLALEVK